MLLIGHELEKTCLKTDVLKALNYLFRHTGIYTHVTESETWCRVNKKSEKPNLEAKLLFS